MEFQCIYSKTTKADYQALIMDGLSRLIGNEINRETRVVDSDRLPDYSIRTIDVEAFVADRWMEVCSVSLRKDFSDEAYVLEIALGLDRCVYLGVKDENS